MLFDRVLEGNIAGKGEGKVESRKKVGAGKVQKPRGSCYNRDNADSETKNGEMRVRKRTRFESEDIRYSELRRNKSTGWGRGDVMCKHRAHAPTINAIMKDIFDHVNTRVVKEVSARLVTARRKRKNLDARMGFNTGKETRAGGKLLCTSKSFAWCWEKALSIPVIVPRKTPGDELV